ncbi:MAG: HEPN domain-containing protein [Ferruginibacter sp.]
MDLIKINKIQKWLDFAREDLEVAEHILNELEFTVFRAVCFNSQQSAEKYLKAYQLYFDLEIVKTHDINYLISTLKEFDNDIVQLEIFAKQLINYAVKYKYPDDFEDLTKLNAQESIQIAKQLQQFILSKIVL